MIIQGLFIWLMPFSYHHIKQLMVVKCLQSTYSLKIRSVVYPASTRQKRLQLLGLRLRRRFSRLVA